MASPPELAQLRDIHLPLPIGWWPLAKGWYLVGVIVVVVVFFITFLIIRYITNQRCKRQALRVLETYRQHYMLQPNSQTGSAQISELLKRVALVYYPRSQVASLQGQAWIDFLTQSSNHLDFNTHSFLLVQCPYQPCGTYDLLPLFHLATMWIKQRRGQCLN